MLEIEQGSEAWLALRRGKVTASRIADVMAKTKSGPAARRRDYAAELVAERLIGETAPAFVNDAMRWGTEHEAEARDLYSFVQFVTVCPVGFVPHPTIAASGASPDGLVGEDGLVEIKCPNTATHMETLLGGSIPDKYRKQMLWQMACTGRAWCDFVSYDPRWPGEMQLFVQRIHRDEAAIAEIEAAVCAFLAEVDETERQLRARYMAVAA